MKFGPDMKAAVAHEATPASPTRSVIERLFNEHNESLLRYLRVRLRSSQDAKEVAQEAYVRLLQLDSLQAVTHFQSFLFRTAINIANDRHRKRMREQRHATLTVLQESSPSAEHTAMQREAVSEVERSLAQLPARCRRAFMLNRIHGLSTSEIAAQMQMTDRMIRIYLSRATLHCLCSVDAQGKDDE